MKLLLDENLSFRLLSRLQELFGEIAHVRDIELKRSPDHEIWQWAKQNDFLIVTTDADIVALSIERGHPPKVIHLEKCDYPLQVIEATLKRNALRISEFEGSHAGVLVLRPVLAT